MTHGISLICPACEGDDLLELPIPHSVHSMLSDGQVLNRPLHKMSCQNCGHGFHSVPPTPKELRGFFDMSYSLGQRNPSAEARRAEFYAEAIADFLAAHGIAWPERLIELGCGMGSLLSELSRRWSCRLAVGLEPSQQLVDAARVNCSVEVEIFQGFAEDLPLPDVSDCDICLSVNVAEHTLSPSGFLSICRSTIREGGRVVVICPDGEQPSSELLFFDHISSFTDASMMAIAAQAGLGRVASCSLTGDLQGFRIHLLEPGDHIQMAQPPCTTLGTQRAEYLTLWRDRWRDLSRALVDTDYAIFGIGEYADLIAAYCPCIVENARLFVADAPIHDMYKGKPVIDTETFLSLNGMKLVAAVHERSWPAVSRRFWARRLEVLHPCVPSTEKETV